MDRALGGGGGVGARGRGCLKLVPTIPGTVPTVFIMNYDHLDLDFYDRFFKPGAYLRTHAEHMERWHGRPEEG